MKLKKIIASLTAAAMAVTTMAFAPLSVSADGETSLIATGGIADAQSVKIVFDCTTDKTNDWEYMYDSWDIIIKTWNNSSNAGDWAKYGVGGSNQAQYYKDAVEFFTYSGTAIEDEEIVYNFVNAPSDVFEVLYKGNGGVYDVTFKTITVYSGKDATGDVKYQWKNPALDSVVYEWQDINVPEPEPNSTNYKFPGRFNTANINGDNAGIEIVVTCDGSTWEGFNLVNNADGSWTKISNDYSTDKAGSYTKFIKFSELTGSLPDENGLFVVSAYNGATLSSIRIKNDSAKGKVYSETVAVDSVTVTPDTATLKIGETTTLTAEVLPADATDKTVTWSSSDEKVATVDKNGKVTAVAAGTATIKAVSNADDTIYGSCEVTVEKNTYAVTVKSNNDAYGTASANVKEAAENDTVELSYTAAKGYKFSKWESEDVTVAKDGTFTMPAKEVTVTAVFEELPPDEYAINITKPVNGKVSVKDGASSAVKNTVIDLVITPDKGYEVDTVKVNGEAITGTSFTMPEKDVTVEVTFKKSTYTVTVAAAANGTVTVDKATAQMGDTVTVTATPDTDYELSKITVNGTAITGNTFTMPAENVTIAAEFKKIGSAGAEVVVPEGVSVSFAGSKEDILKAVFGDDYAALVEAGYKLDVVMTVKDETAVSAEDKALVEGALSGDMHIGLLIDVSLVMTKDGVSTVVENSSKPVSFAIGVPDSIIADGRTYSVIRVHDGAAEDIGGTYDAANKTITVASDKYSTYAVVYKDAPAPQPEPTVTYYPITADRNVTLTASSAAAGTQINVRVDFGYDAYVYCGGRVIDKITEGGSFTMPAGKVTIVTQANGYLVMIKNAAPNSYIFVYDADMNYIKTNGSVKGIKGEGKVTVKLGEEYAGKTVTLYKGRKSTSVKLDSLTLDENGNATFTVEGGKNYTAVVE